jgi:ABC-type antimicrobial peptide transport system permease subunit
MSRYRLVIRSLQFHFRSNLGALIGAAISTAILVGALTVGDSVRQSLLQMALARLGQINLALSSSDRFFQADLSHRMQTNAGGAFASAVQTAGTAAAADGSARANKVQLLGVDRDFWNVSLADNGLAEIPADTVFLNQALAEQLRVKVDGTVLLRVPKPSDLSRDAPLSPEDNSSIALRLRVGKIVGEKQLGPFSLQASQIPPFNAFVSLSFLQNKLGVTNRANLLVADLKEKSGAESLQKAQAALLKAWQLEDGDLMLRQLSNAPLAELRTSRVFLDEAATLSARQAVSNSIGILTYFVNELRTGTNSTPYSMVTAADPAMLPVSLGSDEMVINQWLADDLHAKAGDTIQIKYFVVGSMRQMVEQSTKFKVHSVIPMDAPLCDRTLMPDFPGMTTADNCRDWDTGFPIKTDLIRDKDEKYWHDFRGTPKAFVTLEAGQKLWSNRFGNLTAIRFPLDRTRNLSQLRGLLQKAISPDAVGLTFQPVRAQALAAGNQGQDFGQLFIGFSFFLIAAALLLMALLFQFGIEQRHAEVGTLLAVGFAPRQVRNILLLEGLLIAVLGAIPGTIGGIFYARMMLTGLATIWHSAVGTTALSLVISPVTVVSGALAGIFVAAIAMWLALRKQARQSAVALLAERSEISDSAKPKIGKRSRAFWVAVVSGICGLGTAIWAAIQKNPDPELFFSGGSLMLIAGIAFCSGLVRYFGTRETEKRLSVPGLGIRSISRAPKRSRSVIALLASGSFLIASIGVFRLESTSGEASKSSGTGGFQLWGESSLPIVQNLNSEQGRQSYGLDSALLQPVHVTPIRLREGEDASCLNLNRAQKPRLLGVRVNEFKDRFSFASVSKKEKAEAPWLLLNENLGPDEIPAIGDAASIQWALGKKVGETLSYTDERGREFKLRIVGAVANSILQGNLIISEENFIRRFPSESGYRIFLIDAPSKELNKVSAHLSRALQDFGLELTEADKRLNAFNAVQNTYLSTFQILGGLGLLLGTAGLGVVVLRNVFERRGELGILLALGFRKKSLSRLVLAEHLALLLLGLGVGIFAAGVTVLPGLLRPGQPFPYRSLFYTLSTVFGTGMFFTWFAAQWALRGKLIDSLRNL